MERKSNRFNKRMMKHTLQKLNGKVKSKDFVGFDCETHGDNNEFVMCGFYYYNKGKETFKYFYNKEEAQEFVLKKKFVGKYVVATNLGFDFTTLFWGTKYWNDFEIITGQSGILYAEYKKIKGRIRFIDTTNYIFWGVEKLGKIINSPKIDKPSFLGEKPKNELQKAELTLYNKQDCKISCDFMYFLQSGMNKAGGNLKITSASSSLDIWRRTFLSEPIIKETAIYPHVDEFIAMGYYGGRTEVIKRGTITNAKYYDINSLYPSVMIEDYPLPSSIKRVKGSIENILKYHGVTDCEVQSPNLYYPLLPLKKDGKLIFPNGRFSGVWNNVELRKALELGYKIKPHIQYIYTKTFKPFEKFVNTFYKLRKEQPELSLIWKLYLNSLYGKFAEQEHESIRFINTDNFTTEEYKQFLKEDVDCYRNGNMVVEKYWKDRSLIHRIPIFSSHTTSLARLKIYDYIVKYKSLYHDTDSIITMEEMEESMELGKMKKEMDITNGILIKPKMYMVNDNVKMKGIATPNMRDFECMLRGDPIGKIKFTKLKESIRRGINPNTKININKLLNLEDDKRLWTSEFDYKVIQSSKPLVV